jgi:hypothetical protein
MDEELYYNEYLPKCIRPDEDIDDCSCGAISICYGSNSYGAAVECSSLDCFKEGPLKTTRQDAIEAWNSLRRKNQNKA